MLILFETAAGYSLFKVLDESKITDAKNVFKEFKNQQKRSNLIQLYKFQPFKNMEEAAEATRCIQDTNKLHKSLSKFLKKNLVKKNSKESLAVIDTKLGGLIKDKYNINIVHDSAIMELQRGLREHVIELLAELSENEDTSMKLGLSHALCRHKLQFSAEKVDTMIVQAIALLDELDKEVNIYAMRVKEWYGWHFPEMVKIVSDNMHYCRVIQTAGYRKDMAKCDLSEILAEETENELKNMAKISMGSQITEEDLTNIRYLCKQVLELADYRSQLYEYLKNRMMAIAPTLTMMVGELVGARLLAHAGSLVSLAKYPASTVQILGAEKALFRALKQATDTPKYGLIYHASFVNAASQPNKARVARTLACKTILATRIDAFTTAARAGDKPLIEEYQESKETDAATKSQEFAVTCLDKMQKRIDKLEGRKVQVKSKTVAGAVMTKHEFGSPSKTYDDSGDIVIKKEEGFKMEPVSSRRIGKKRKRPDDDIEESQEETSMEPAPKRQRISEEASPTPVKKEKKKKKKKKKKSDASEAVEETPQSKQADVILTGEEETSSKKKKKKKKKHKESTASVVSETQSAQETPTETSAKKKKKKKKKKSKKDKQ